MPPPARVLSEEIVEEILLRLPPDEPTWIVRASLASKLWLGLLSSARFRGRYRDFHGAAPMLGFLESKPWNCLESKEGNPVPPFFSTTGFRPRIPDDGWGHRDYAVWDCRHGRVLLGERKVAPLKLAVWDPMTGRCTRDLQEPGSLWVEHKDGFHAAAVLCNVAGCDHCACHEGPFRVVFFSLRNVGSDLVAQVCVSSTATGDLHCGAWSEPCSGISITNDGFMEPSPSVLVKDALHFMLGFGYDTEGGVHVQILKYDLSSNSLSLIDAPLAGVNMLGVAILLAMEDGSLGFARVKGLTVQIWTRQMGSDGVGAWSRRRVIDLKNLPPVQNPKKYISLLGSVEGSDIIFMYTRLGIYKINLKTLQQKKIWKGECINNALIPYMSFYRPRERVTACDAAQAH